MMKKVALLLWPKRIGDSIAYVTNHETYDTRRAYTVYLLYSAG